MNTNSSIIVLLKDKNKELEEVIINKKSRAFSSVNGNIKVDVASSIFKSVQSSVDLLQKLPRVQLSSDKEKVSLVGKGNPLIYIDNQKVELKDLKSLSVEDIKTIEIINNPSSKYEAEGRAVILITRKFSKKEGMEITIDETASFKKRFNNYLSVNTVIKRKNTEFKANIGYNMLNPWESSGNNFIIPDYSIVSNYLAESFTKRKQLMYGAGVFHQLSETEDISLNINGRFQDDKDDITTHTFNDDNSLVQNILTLNNNINKRNFLNSFANYNKRFEHMNAKLFGGIQYSHLGENTDSWLKNDFNNTGLNLSQNRNQNFSVDVFSMRTDFEKEFKNEMKLETGLLFLNADAKSKFNVIDYNSNTNNQNINYDFKERNMGGYAQLGGKIKSINYSVGARVENTYIKGRYSGSSADSVDKNYTNFFPKAEINIPIDSSNTISFNYARSIERPNYSSSNQASVYLNPYVTFSRNINLNPTFSSEVSTTFQHKDKYLRLTFYQRKDPVYFSFYYHPEIKLIDFKSINYEKESGFNAELSVPFSYRIWNSSTNLNFIVNKIQDPSASTVESKPYLYYYSNHLFDLPKGFKLSVTGWGFTKRKEGAFDRNALFIMNLAVSKTFFKDLETTLSFNDIFRKMNFNENITVNNINALGLYYTDTREISLSLKYKFGNAKNLKNNSKEVNENTNRIR
ncbi:outer membrane beta-barrel family protein [Chryseobacterium gallinarum]|uniref:Outer membrane beta-barrel protein n=1 Tax=Chryseobacterium gallinarum TaxID=1324352 RepID=A0ABX6KQ36_CHRGL|nr:outer membrane beta-barrel family protein [Chryseobacterium gallinarum]QIY90734.1 outer membrane beta-barrel protein [Chryseobacterium gallinarum]